MPMANGSKWTAEINGGQYPHWSSPLTPEAVQPDAILPDLYVATWHIASVRRGLGELGQRPQGEPGTYHICYCSYIIGTKPNQL